MIRRLAAFSPAISITTLWQGDLQDIFPVHG